jgi:hypothetical protein
MKISNQLPKTQKEEALVIVAGKQAAVVYEIRSGNLTRLDAIKIPTPKYSDNEGHFRTQSRGAVLRAGSVRESQDDNVINEFLREFSKLAKKLPTDRSHIYIIAPSQTKNRLAETLIDSERRKVRHVTEGNFYYRSPKFIAEKVEEILNSD